MKRSNSLREFAPRDNSFSETWGDEKEVPLVPKVISLRSKRSLIQFLCRLNFINLKTTS
jgi:hypothetical protein